jgi:putative transposase
MAYPPRIFIPDVSLHVFPRGINGQAVARDEEDTEHLRRVVAEAAADYGVAIHAFAFMTTHYHLIVTPTTDGGLSGMMQLADGRHTKYFNRKYERMGTIWNERYGATLLKDEHYWYTCLRYVDENPFRAHIVSSRGDSRRSSYPVHAFGDDCEWLTPHELYLKLGSTPDERQMAYRAMCLRQLTDDELDQHRDPRRRVVHQATT